MVLVFLAAFMLASAGVSLFNDHDSAFYPLLLSSFLTATLGLFPLIFVERAEEIKTKEGYAIVVGSWLVACVVGTIPYLIWGGEFTIVNAWFESVSGFTTTGASILNDIEFLPRGMLFWRSATTWIGGIGVVMFALVILPSLGRSRQLLYNVELSTIAKDNFHYRSREIMRILVFVYVGLTLVTTVLLKLSGMCWFDALCQAMSACSTCGFGTKNTSIAFFNSGLIEFILILAMCISGLHFGLIYATITGKQNNVFRSEVSRVYFSIIGVSSVLIAISLWLADIYPTLWLSLRSSLFHTVSMFTTSGFSTVDCNTWTSFAILILIFCSIICGCAGSTSGGLKVDRFLVAAKMIRTRLRAQRHPDAIFRTKIDGVVQDEGMMGTVMVYIVTFMLLILAGTFINTLLGVDLMTGFSAALACTSNVGPGFGEVGTMSNYSLMPALMKLNSTFLMLLGRLEIFGLIQLFFIRWWR